MSGIGRQNAQDDPHRGRLAGSVGTYESENLTTVDVE
jgi:hypothetical protein